MPAATRALRRLALTAAIGWAQVPPAAAQGCAMCRTALSQSPEGRAMAASFNHAILIMLAAPYLVFAVCLAYLFRHRLRLGWDRWRARWRPPALAPRSRPAV